MLEMYRFLRIIFRWNLIKFELFKLIKSGIKVNPKIGHYFLNNLMTKEKFFLFAGRMSKRNKKIYMSNDDLREAIEKSWMYDIWVTFILKYKSIKGRVIKFGSSVNGA